YVWYELSFDRFHSKYDQIYRVVDTRHQSNGDFNFGGTGWRVAEVLKEEFPEIIQSANLTFLKREVELSYNDRKFIEEPGCVLVAHPEIFDIFDINLTLGDPETALLDPNSIILTEEESRKYFGNESPIGKFINIRVDENELLKEEIEENLMVTGVAKAMPANSHFSFKFIIHRKKLEHQWDFTYLTAYTYLTLPVGYPPEKLEEKFPEIVKKYYPPEIEESFKTTYDEWLESGYYVKLGLQPLKHIHLDSHYQDSRFIKKGNLFHVQIYTVIALFIIALACINFITLSTARSGERAKEVGIRKVTGARRVQLIWQFLAESVLLSVIALVFAIIMVAIFSKPFNNLLEIQTSHNN
ncbi:MAG: FtsX-like permease family protein, partial [Cyclobacteriaceae bacterium]|nr:FtsX-like permease family protein [Cyclobacteriaceae bacterium]